MTNLELVASHISQAISCLEKERTVEAWRLVDMLMPIVSGVNAPDKASSKPFFTKATLARGAPVSGGNERPVRTGRKR